MKPLLLFCSLLCCVGAAPLAAQDGRPVYETTRITGEPPVVDGALDDEAWTAVAWGENKYQWEPDDAAPPSQRTLFKVLYDNRYLYVAWRAFDDEPGKIEPRLGRRDEFNGDWVEINFDSFNDKRTGFSFNVGASGVRGDEFISQDGEEWDGSWNPTWDGKSQLDSLGYTAEARIPLSQLRFGKADRQEWGMQVNRRIFRTGELDVWAPVKQAEQGWVSRFGRLRGLDGIRARKPLEVQPYVLAQLRTGGKFADDDPFGRTTDSRLSTGVDGRVGLSNDIVADFTINPDFGQVEADPGAINLDGFQIFFREQRPFFVEGRNIYDFRLGGDLLFYSRRIGGAPSRFIPEDQAVGRFVRQPENTTILGAAKVSGKTRDGLSIGLLSSVTERERATIIDLDGERKEVVEPLTTYNVGRLQQDFNEGNSSLGVMLTGVNRGLEDDGFLADRLHKSAYSGGLDLVHRWKDRAWQLQASGIFSQVRGSLSAINRTQTAFEHLFQRPDADHLSVDTSATRLTGTGGSVALSEEAGKWTFRAEAGYRSPELELNDIGFMNSTDEIGTAVRVSRRWRTPFGKFNNLTWTNRVRADWDFGGNSLGRSFNTGVFGEFRNFSGFNLFVNAEQQDISRNALRGGPLLRRPRGYFVGAGYRTDSRKKIVVGVDAAAGGGFDGNVRGQSVGLDLNYQPTDALGLSANLNVDWNERNDQYVATLTRSDGTQDYLHGSIERQTVSLTLRATYNLTPDFTVQYYGQPFVARGVYDRFKNVADPLAKDFGDRFVDFTTDQIRYDEVNDRYRVSYDGGATADYTFGNPDFNFLQFRSNLVVRWEYKPSSVLFLVWSQGTTGGADPAKTAFAALADDLFAQDLRNTFLLKATYRLVR